MQLRLDIYRLFAASFLVFFSACKKDDVNTLDTERPAINLTGDNTFPKQCTELRRGEKFIFKAKLTDNKELGTFSIDIHHNFDHHTHSTEVEECDLQPVKTPVNPFLFIKSYDIPGGQKSYETNVEIGVPADIDPGDYHFTIMVTDQEGWNTMKGLSIKIR